jgi:hypothetical protein
VNQRFNVYIREGFSSSETLEKANITNAAYLEPNSDSMQKLIEGLPVLAVFSTKSAEGKRL